MAASFGRSFVQVAVLVAGVLCTGTEAGFAAAPLVAPVAATTYLAAGFPAQGVLRSAYSQVVGRSYAPSSFVPVSSSLAYAAPVAQALPTAYLAAPQLVAGPVLKTVAAPSAVAVPFATRFAAVGTAPVAYAAPAPVVVAPSVVRAAAVPVPALAPAFAPSAVLASRFAPLPAPAAVPLGGVAPASGLPGVVEARDASAPTGAATRGGQTTFLTAFGSPEGIRLVSGAGLEGTALTGVASTNVESARSAPAGPQSSTGSGRAAASPAQPPSNPETFGVPQQTPFGEYGVPAAPGASVSP